MRRRFRWAVLVVVLFFAFVPAIAGGQSHQQRPAADSSRVGLRICRRGHCATAFDSMRRADSLRARARAWIDSVRLDSIRRAQAPGQRSATVQPATVGALVRRLDGAPVMSDSQYTADTTAIVRGLYPYWVPQVQHDGAVAAIGLGALVVGATFSDRGGYRDRDDPFSTANLSHAPIAASLALITDDGFRGVPIAILATVLHEVGQMRPSGFPAAHRGQRLGKFSLLDVGVGVTGAVAGPTLRWGWRKVTR